MTRTPSPLDPRVNPYRPDLAAAFLYGKVEAERYVDGVPCQVRAGYASLRAEPNHGAAQTSQLLFGEVFTVMEENDGWVWGQNATDGYVGYLHLEALDAEVVAATHRVSALRTFLYAAPDLKSPVLDLVSLNAQVTVEDGGENGFAFIAGGAYIHAAHLVELAAPGPGPTPAQGIAATARRFIGTPYLWGGRTSVGLDCSALVQMALQAEGLACPRDSDQQQAALGTLVSGDGAGHAYAAGDIVFFPGHVGIMADAATLIHANAFHMATVAEPLADVVARGTPITAVKRLS